MYDFSCVVGLRASGGKVFVFGAGSSFLVMHACDALITCFRHVESGRRCNGSSGRRCMSHQSGDACIKLVMHGASGRQCVSHQAADANCRIRQAM